MAGSELRAFYDRYLAVCNAHEFDRLGEFVWPDVEVNDVAVGLSGYRTGLEMLIQAFPDYRWIIRHRLVHDRLPLTLPRRCPVEPSQSGHQRGNVVQCAATAPHASD